MMEYSTFKAVAEKKILDYLPEEFKNAIAIVFISTDIQFFRFCISFAVCLQLLNDFSLLIPDFKDNSFDRFLRITVCFINLNIAFHLS